MHLWLILIIIIVLIIILFIFVVKYINKISFDNGFRYGYENNPVINNSVEEIKESIKLLKSITLYKKNKQVVNKVITILEDIDEVSKVSVEEEENESNKISVLNFFKYYIHK